MRGPGPATVPWNGFHGTNDFQDFRALLAFQLAEQRPAYAVFPNWMWRSMQGAGHLDGLERQVLWEHASTVLARLREQRE